MCDKNEITNSKLSLLHANVRSLPRNGTALEAYLSTLKVEFNVVALTETWLNETNADVYGLTGYKAIHNYRKQKQEQSETAWYAHLPASVNALLVYCA